MISLIQLLVLHVFVVQISSFASSAYNFTERAFQTVPSCGGIFNTHTFQLTSPQWPGEYPAGIDCDYVVEPISPAVCILQVEFLDFQLPVGDSNCNSDSLTIAGNLFCGEVTGAVTIPFQQPMSTVHFRSLDGVGKGFNILIRQIECPIQEQSQTICGGVYNGRNVEIFSPGYPNFYSNNIDCSYTVKRINEGCSQFVLTFLDGIIEESEGCKKDKLVIGEDVLCGTLVGSKIYSTENDLSINFITDSDNVNKGFRIIVEQVQCSHINAARKQDEVTPYPLQQYPYPQLPQPQINPTLSTQTPSQYQCCGRTYNDKNFLLVSPGFPKSQPSDCLYTITKYSPTTYQLRFQFIFFWISDQNNNNQFCVDEFLEIDGKQICGCKTGLVLTSTFEEVWETEKVISLRTIYNSNRPFSGFVLEVFQDEYTRQKRSNEIKYPFSPQYRNYSSENINLNSGLITPRNLISKRNLQTGTNMNNLPYVWDPIQKFWSLSQNVLCLRWGINDFVILIRELLWSQYQCPGKSYNNEATTNKPKGMFKAGVPIPPIAMMPSRPGLGTSWGGG